MVDLRVWCVIIKPMYLFFLLVIMFSFLYEQVFFVCFSHHYHQHMSLFPLTQNRTIIFILALNIPHLYKTSVITLAFPLLKTDHVLILNKPSLYRYFESPGNLGLIKKTITISTSYFLCKNIIYTFLVFFM